ncbi:MAG: NUDIX domain-containing protein [Halieaceae bacterium]|jgi:ADP-ribose pyrophosphatase|nr:NUDIX domain-containing protein [Halieaceae bacterium]
MNLKYSFSDVRVLADEDAYRGHYRMRRITLEHRRFDGGWSEPVSRELFERGDAVGVLLWDPVRDELVMLEQFRVGAIRGADSPWMLELVAGVVEPGESDADVAHRETAEESGLPLTALEPIVTFFPSPGGCSEQVRLFVGRVDSADAGGVHGCDNEGEDILVHRLARAEVMAMLDADRINNGHTLVALQWLRIHGDALRERWT